MGENTLLDKYHRIEDESDKIEFLSSLSKIQDKEVLEVFKEAMGDQSWRVRKTAIEGLLLYYDLSAVVDLLMELVHEEENANLRNSAIEGLVRLGKKAVPRIIEALPEENDEIKKFYVDILGEIGDKSVIPAITQLLNTTDENLSLAIIEVTGKLGDENVIELLLGLLEEKKDNLNAVFCIFGALRDILSRNQKIKLPIEKFIPFLDEPLLKKAFLELAGYISDSRVIGNIMENLNAPQKGIREAAYRALYKFYVNNEPLRKELINRLTTKDVKKELLYKALNSSNAETKHGAALVLAVKKETESIPQILRSMEGNKDFYLEIMKYFGEGLVEKIHEICFDFDDDTKSFMCNVISQMGTEKSETLMLDLLETGSEKLIQSVAQALSKIGTEKSVEPLVRQLTKTESQETAEAIINALKNLSRDYPGTIIRAIDKYIDACVEFHCKRNFLNLIGETGFAEYWKKVSSMLKDNNPEIRKWALRTLRQLRVKESFFHVQPLCFDEDEKVRVEAIKTLAAIGGKDALDYFKILKEDPNFWIRLESLKALEEILGDSAIEFLKDKIEDPIGAVAVVALEILDRHWKTKYRDMLKKAFFHPDSEVVHTAIEIALAHGEVNLIKETYKELSIEEKKKLIKSLYRIPTGTSSTSLIKELLTMEEDPEIKQALTGLTNAG